MLLKRQCQYTIHGLCAETYTPMSTQDVSHLPAVENQPFDSRQLHMLQLARGNQPRGRLRRDVLYG